MTGPGTVDLYVDLDALRELGTEIQSLINALADTQCRPPADGGSLGGHDVSEAVNRFTGRWTEGRQQITENLQSCLTLVQLAIDGYRQAETGLQSSLTPVTRIPEGARR